MYVAYVLVFVLVFIALFISMIASIQKCTPADVRVFYFWTDFVPSCPLSLPVCFHECTFCADSDVSVCECKCLCASSAVLCALAAARGRH